MGDSLNLLDGLGLLEDSESDSANEGNGREDSNNIHHVTSQVDAARQPSSDAARRMEHRGVPYFEEMIEHSRLGRIRRRKGADVSSDGTTVVQWEIAEMDGPDDVTMTSTTETTAAETSDETSERAKRPKLEP